MFLFIVGLLFMLFRPDDAHITLKFICIAKFYFILLAPRPPEAYRWDRTTGCTVTEAAGSLKNVLTRK